MYRPKEGREAELENSVKLHLGKLLELKLVNEKNSFSGQSTDGTIIEIFEWASSEAKRMAHEHPEVESIWNQIAKICDFPAMKDLPEAHSPFPNFGAL